MLKKLAKDLFFRLILLLTGTRLGKRAAILAYHSVGAGRAFFTIGLSDFEQQLTYLKTKKYRIIKLSELIERLRSGEDISNCVALTFDDGLLDNYEEVYPLLKKYQIPATIFLATDLLGQVFETSAGDRLPMMSAEQARALAQDDLIELMPHTAGHIYLDRVDYQEAVADIEKSRQRVEELTSQPASILAYPKGLHRPKIINYLESHNWLGGVTSAEGLVRAGDNVFLLKRNSVDSTTSFTQFRAKLSPAIDFYTKLKL